MFPHNEADGPNSKTTQCFIGFTRWRHKGDGILIIYLVIITIGADDLTSSSLRVQMMLKKIRSW